MSQISVASYLKGIPPGNENPEKPKIIKNFINGVNACGDKGAVVTGWQAIMDVKYKALYILEKCSIYAYVHG